MLIETAKTFDDHLLVQCIELIDRFFTLQHDLSDNAVQSLLFFVPESVALTNDLATNVPMLRRIGAGKVDHDHKK